MGLRKASSYSKKKVTPYTRTSKRKNKAFIKTIPPQKIVKFTMGNTGAFNEGKFPFKLEIISAERAQIRHNALEACRQYINKQLDSEFPGQYLFKVVPYPHHIQRENKMLTGAGADRMSKGMQLAFGRSSGKAAIVNQGSVIFSVAVANQKAEQFVRKIVNQVKSKLPCHIKIVSVGTGK